MAFRTVATDYDGTLAHEGRVEGRTRAALERFRDWGGRISLVTGRELGELLALCDCIDLFDRVVAENGAVLYCPSSLTRVRLAPPPPPSFVEELRRSGVEPLSVGEVIVATRRPHEVVVLERIRTWGLPLQVILNKRAVMILPAGVDKASGLAAALEELKISSAATVAIGDAENDAALLDYCGVGVAVANAVPELKARADLVTAGARGEGVVELIDRIMVRGGKEIANDDT